MKHLKKLTLLHSNDMHGDFMAKEVDDRLIGGVMSARCAARSEM